VLIVVIRNKGDKKCLTTEQLDVDIVAHVVTTNARALTLLSSWKSGKRATTLITRNEPNASRSAEKLARSGVATVVKPGTLLERVTDTMHK